MSNDQQKSEEKASEGGKPAYDLEERTAKFGEAIIEFCQGLTETSVGANYCEADDAVSRKEFMLKIGTCKKESKETRFWLRMIAKALPGSRSKARPLWKEATELLLIFAAIYRKK